LNLLFLHGFSFFTLSFRVRKIRGGSERHYYSRSDLREQVSGFVRLCATELLGIGAATYEIVFFKDRTTSEKKGFLLFYIDPRTLFTWHNATYQYGSPKAVRNRDRKGATLLPADRLLVFRLPAKYQRLSQKTKIVRELGGLNVFRVAEEQQREKGSVYNFKEHHRAEQLALASATRETGWSMGGILGETFLEYYGVWRYLVYNRFAIELRDEILNTLNAAIKRISPNFGPETAMVIKGVPTLEDVEKAFQDLQSGSRSLVSLVEQFSL
jgi:hypothetical protein